MTTNSGAFPERKVFPAGTEIHEGGKYIFVLDEMVDCGGEAIVYKGHAKSDGHIVAVKLMYRLDDPLTLLRFQRVVEIQKKVRGMNVLPLENSGIFMDGDDSYPFFVFPFIKDGRTLERILQEAEEKLPKGEKHKGTAIPYSDLLHYAAQAGNGLLSVHSSGVVHRDVKPSNILIAGVGESAVVRLMDLGVSKFYEEGLESVPRNITVELGVKGTPAYLAPELAQGYIGVSSDIWAFGVVLYEMVTLRSPFNFESGNMMTVLKKVVHGSLRPIAIGEFCEGVDPYLENLIMKCLAYDPEDRPQSMEEVLEELNRMQLRLPQISMSEIPPNDSQPVINPTAETITATPTPEKVISVASAKVSPQPATAVARPNALNKVNRRVEVRSPTIVEDKKRGSGRMLYAFLAAALVIVSGYFGYTVWQDGQNLGNGTIPAASSVAPRGTASVGKAKSMPVSSAIAPAKSSDAVAVPSALFPKPIASVPPQPTKSSAPKPTNTKRRRNTAAPLPLPGVDYVPGADGP